MASRIGLSYRNEAARARLEAALAALGEQGGGEARPAGRRRDGALEATLRLEWMAEVLERVAATAQARAEEMEEMTGRVRALEEQQAKAGEGEGRTAQRTAKRGG